MMAAVDMWAALTETIHEEVLAAFAAYDRHAGEAVVETALTLHELDLTDGVPYHSRPLRVRGRYTRAAGA